MRCERLDIWKRSCRLSVEVYKNFENCKDFGFKDQITRSSLSMGSNIAEGLEKESTKEKVRYIEIAKGSGAESVTQIYIGIEIGYIEKERGILWVKEVKEILRMLASLKRNYVK